MDGYAKADTKEALAKRSPRQARFDAITHRLIIGPMMFVIAALFHVFLVGHLAMAFWDLTLGVSLRAGLA